MKNLNNKEYWNQYVAYWDERTAAAEGENNIEDKTSGSDVLSNFFRQLGVEREDKFLDYGCGLCRLLPIYTELVGSENYVGVDLSKTVLELAEKRYYTLKIQHNLFEFDGLHLPFADSTYDKIFCFGVFDACEQEKSLAEMIRILKPGGKLLFTGKNTNYFIEDEKAFIAEINARKKEHPNFFTYVEKLLMLLNENSLNILDQFYFLKRGDFADYRFVKIIPEKFYEWALIIQKTERSSRNFEKFSETVSETYRTAQQVNMKVE